MIRTVGRFGVLVCALSSACAATTTTDGTGQVNGAPGGPTPASAAVAFGSGGKPSGAAMTMGAVATRPSQVTPAAIPASVSSAPATPMAAAPGAPAAPVPGASNAPDPAECGLHTNYRGDEYCIKPPPADKGFQLHIGPSDYANPEARYILEPGQEVTEPYMGMSTNDQDIYYFYRQQRMRPGSHHLLISYGTDLIVSAQNPLADTPAGGKIAPEDQDVGMTLPAHSPLFGSIHFINTSDKPILKEIWVNFWYKDGSTVKEHAQPIFTGAPINIPPGAHTLVASDCPIMGSGRIIRLFGHKHANNVRWSTYRVRGGQRDLLFEDYDHWEDPLILEYSSITQNPKPDRATKTPGGWSGMVEVQTGDTMRFECEIVNNTTKTFTGQNEAIDDEMCIQNGTIVGASIMRGTCMTSSTPVN